MIVKLTLSLNLAFGFGILNYVSKSSKQLERILEGMKIFFSGASGPGPGPGFSERARAGPAEP